MFKKLTIIGHRGAAGLKPENTLPSFILALDLGCRVLELDVHRLVNEQDSLAVVHDSKLDRTTNLRGQVANFTHHELRNAKPPVPMLVDVIEAILEWCTKNTVNPEEILLNIELKGLGTAKATQQIISEHPALTYIVSSFNHDELKDFRQLDELTAVAPLFDRWQTNCVEIANNLNATGINLSKRIVTKARVEEIHAAGYQIWVYTVNTKRSALRMERLGVDGIFTDRPDRMLRAETR